MSAKVVQFKQQDMFAETLPQKPYKYITQEEFMEFVKSSLSCLFANNSEAMKLNEFLILHQLELQDKIIEQQEAINKLKNP